MINVTPSAATKISELLTEENKTDAGLRVFVQGGGCSGFQYGLMIDEGEGDASTDSVIESNGVKLLVDPISARYLAARKWISSTTSPAAASRSRTRTRSRRAAAVRPSASRAAVRAARGNKPLELGRWVNRFLTREAGSRIRPPVFLLSSISTFTPPPPTAASRRPSSCEPRTPRA